MKRSEECAPCPAGEYCAGYGLKEPTGPCDAGFYCSGRACTSVSIKTGLAWVVLNLKISNYSMHALYMRWYVPNEMRSAKLAVTISYPTSTIGRFVSLKMPPTITQILTIFVEHGIMAHKP